MNGAEWQGFWVYEPKDDPREPEAGNLTVLSFCVDGQPHLDKLRDLGYTGGPAVAIFRHSWRTMSALFSRGLVILKMASTSWPIADLIPTSVQGPSRRNQGAGWEQNTVQ